MSTALYRRYRPEAFAEMIGQSQVTDPLMTALRSDRIGHAYLFSGPRGCGKTTSARILARCLNCAEGPTDTPCGTCDSCVELSRDGGGSLDVVEIDAASHNGVDDARDLRERAVFAPARDRYKIFILDEAHMVTPQGFNALLKLVEEPPAHVKFIFATTEPDKVIGTIRSRTHHYPFRLVPPASMLEYVEKLCDQEQIAPEPGVLSLVVRAGAGSPRDTLSILDQLIAGSEGQSVSYARAVALLGYTHGELLDDVAIAFAARDAAAAFGAVDRVVQTGQDPRRFVDDLLERLRDLIVIAATGDQAATVLRGLPADELERMQAQAAAYGSARLSRAADIVSSALDQMTGATSPRLQLELMIARVLTADGATSDEPTAPAAQPSAVTPSAAQIEVATAPPAAPVQPVAAPVAPPVAAPPAAHPAAAPPAAPPVVEPVERDDVVVDQSSDDAAAAAAPVELPVSERPVSEQPASEQSAEPDTSEGPAAAPASSTDERADAAEQATADDAAAPPIAPAGPPESDEGPAAAWATSSEAPPEPLTLASLQRDWPQILASLEQSSRSSWLTLQSASAVHVADDVVGLVFTNQTDLGQFKTRATDGSGVSADLRTAIAEVTGFTVKFLAKHVPAAGTDRAPAVSAAPVAPPAPAEAAPSAPPATSYAASPASGWAVAPIPNSDADEQNDDSAGPADEAVPVDEARPAAPPASAGVADPAPSRGETVAPDRVDAPEAAAASAVSAAAPPPFSAPVDEPTDDDVPPDPYDDPYPPEEAAPSGPTVQRRQVHLDEGVQRYGEAVVRQKLGAVFLHEEEYTPPTRFQ
ncbi:MAG: DNA polymerase III subunit gamma and tau [Microbacterium gubbeenense]|uniref:DNA polymerase III subunit gamma and tau n=1 Tax=Microbacterium gubbeenense TaxID=159896 RepID=UPI003F9AE5FC